MIAIVELSFQDVEDLRLEIALLTDYLGNLGPPETEEHRQQRATNERRLDLMRRLVVKPPPSTTEGPLTDIDVAVVKGWVAGLRGPVADLRYDWRDREKLARLLERLLDIAPRRRAGEIGEVTEPEPVSRPFKPDQKRLDDGDWHRAGGDCICATCGFAYYEHAELRGYPTFRQLCDGRLVKL